MLAVRPILAALSIVLTASSPSWAQKTDVVTLANGDRITGEIKNVNRGRLEFSTDDAGTLEIEWDKVARLVAKRRFEVETSDLRRLLGSLDASVDRTLAVATPDGVVSLPMIEVTRITPIGASFWSKLDGSIDAGFSYTHSSGIAQTNLNADMSYRRPAFVFLLSSSATITQRSDGTERDDRSAFSAGYTRYRGRWLFGGFGALESNESLGLVLRSALGAVAGLRVVNNNSAHVELVTGVTLNNEQGVDAEPTENVEAILGARGSFYKYDRPKTTLDGDIKYFPSLTNSGRHRLQTEGDVRRELFKDFFVALNVFYLFDSEPPNPDAEKMDVGTVASVGWSF